MNNNQQIKHLFARAGFGLRFEDVQAWQNVTVKHAVKSLLDAPADDHVAAIPTNTDVYKRQVRYVCLVKSTFSKMKTKI